MRNRIKKHMYYYYSLLVVGLLGVSCSEVLDLKQPDEGSEDVVYSSVEDLQLALNGVYSLYAIDANGNGLGDAIWFNDLFTDNIKKGTANAGQGVETYQFILESSSNTPQLIWNNRLAVARRINIALRAADRIEQTIEAVDVRNRFNHIKAQLLTWRAICHYDMFVYYTPSYTDSNALSCFIADFVSKVSDQPERKTVGEVVSFIIQDLENAKSLIAPGTNDPFVINADVIDAFRTKLALVTADYNTAGTMASNLLAKYPLANRADYKSLWEDLGSRELIFGLTRNGRSDRSIAGCWYNVATNADGAPWFEMSEQLYSLYYAGDVRIDEILLDATSNIPNKMFLINKYPGIDGFPLMNNVKLIRSSEMAFILAETQARSGDLASATNTLQDLINIRYAPNIPPASETISFSNVNDALTRILLERRKELCFEGHRYLDLKRFGVGVNRLADDAKSFSSSMPTDLSAGDYRFTFPIPQSEMSANNNVVQNTGYTNN